MAAPAKLEGPLTLAIPAQGAYNGAYMDFGDNEDDVTLDAIEDFEALAGKHQAIIASSSYWGEQTFPLNNVKLISRHGSIPLIFWSPWDEPYSEDDGPDKFSLIEISAGKWDAYIDKWADAARDFGHPIMVSFANEMNGTWFPWSGYFYGGGDHAGPATTPYPLPTPYPVAPPPETASTPTATPVPATPPPPYKGPFAGPETFKKAYRHVVDRVRARGARNVIWVFHVMNYSIPQEEWNEMAQYYPGSDYVDWVGLSVYGEQYSEDPWCAFGPLVRWHAGEKGGPYDELCALDPQKPFMLTEWGVGEFPKKGNKADFIADALGSMQKNMPRLKAAIFWHERWQNEDGTYSNLRADSTVESLKAFRQGTAKPFWLGEPIWGSLVKPAHAAGAK